MFEESNTPYSIPVSPTGSGGMFNGDGWWAIIIFALIFGWGGGGLFGNGAGNTVQDGYVLASDFANIERKIDGVNNGLCSLGYDQLAQMNGINQNVSNTGYNLQSAINNQGYETRNAVTQAEINRMQSDNSIQQQISNCCCENRQAIAQLNYNMATQACETKQAVADGTKQILDFLTQDKIASLTAENQSLKFAASQQAQNGLLTTAMAAQTNQLINAINPTAMPAYIVPNPNSSYNSCPYN